MSTLYEYSKLPLGQLAHTDVPVCFMEYHPDEEFGICNAFIIVTEMSFCTYSFSSKPCKKDLLVLHVEQGNRPLCSFICLNAEGEFMST